MRINSDQIDQHTRNTLAPFYWISGDETLLVQECLTLLRSRCRKAGFTEWELFFVERSFDWQSMLQAGNSMSLFSDKKIMELRVTGKLEDEGKAALKQYLQAPNPDNVLLLISPRIEPATQNSQWFKALEATGVFVTVWPVKAERLAAWMQGRMKSQGLSADHDTLATLADRVEGNLLAADQEIQKLRILTGATPEQPVHLQRKHIMSLVADNARYSVFSLIDAALLGDARRSIKVINGLRADGSELLQILGAVSAELRRLIAIAHSAQAGHSSADAMRREGVRPNNEKAVTAAVKRHTLVQLQEMLRSAREVDMAVKGMSPADPWLTLTQLILRLAGQHILPSPVLS